MLLLLLLLLLLSPESISLPRSPPLLRLPLSPLLRLSLRRASPRLRITSGGKSQIATAFAWQLPADTNLEKAFA
jgi:hypothetical protein